MSIKDHLIKLTMWWQGAQKLRNDRPGGAAAPPAPPSVSPLLVRRYDQSEQTCTIEHRHCLCEAFLGSDRETARGKTGKFPLSEIFKVPITFIIVKYGNKLQSFPTPRKSAGCDPEHTHMIAAAQKTTPLMRLLLITINNDC